jgi:hypothetical protein
VKLKLIIIFCIMKDYFLIGINRTRCARRSSKSSIGRVDFNQIVILGF